MKALDEYILMVVLPGTAEYGGGGGGGGGGHVPPPPPPNVFKIIKS